MSTRTKARLLSGNSAGALLDLQQSAFDPDRAVRFDVFGFLCLVPDNFSRAAVGCLRRGGRRGEQQQTQADQHAETHENWRRAGT
jgi:hypothetical protein